MLLISNRDEFYHRPTRPLQHWANTPIYAGQDLQQGGTWLGITAQGRWAILTNLRDGTDQKVYRTSRGHLIQDFLCSDLSPMRFMQQLQTRQQAYAGFNLLVGDLQQAGYMSNRGEAPQLLAKGVYVISNGLMSEDWQKVAHLRKRFTQELLPLLQWPHIAQDHVLDLTWDILQDQRKLPEVLLPDTGISKEMEQLLSSTFIESAVYGTRCSNFLQIEPEQIQWWEKTQQGDDRGKVHHIRLPLHKKNPHHQ